MSTGVAILPITAPATGKIETLIVAQVVEVAVLENALLHLPDDFRLQFLASAAGAARLVLLARPVRQVPVLLLQLVLLRGSQVAEALEVQLVFGGGVTIVQEIVLLVRAPTWLLVVGAAQFQGLDGLSIDVHDLWLAAGLQRAGEQVVGDELLV